MPISRESKYSLSILIYFTVLTLSISILYFSLANNQIVFSFKPSNAVSTANSSAFGNSYDPNSGPNSENKEMELFLTMPNNKSTSNSHFVTAFALDSFTSEQVDRSKIYISVIAEKGTLLGLYSGNGSVTGSWVSAPGTVQIVANATAEGYKPVTKRSSFMPALGISNGDSSDNGACKKIRPIGVNASSFETDPKDYHPAVDAIDGDTDTWWSNQGFPSWVKIQLGKSVSICSIEITWNKGDERTYNFSISTSADGNIYNKIYSGKSEKSPSAQKYSLTGDHVAVIKLDINGSNSKRGWASIKEIDIFAH